MGYYFAPELCEEACYRLETIKDLAKMDGIKEVEVFKAKRVTGEGHYYCTFFGEPGDSSDGNCGKQCIEYSPRNGKNGRCRHSGYCYEKAGEKRTIKVK